MNYAKRCKNYILLVQTLALPFYFICNVTFFGRSSYAKHKFFGLCHPFAFEEFLNCVPNQTRLKFLISFALPNRITAR